MKKSMATPQAMLRTCQHTGLGLSCSACLPQVDLDSLDQNKNVNKAGQIVGNFAKSKANQISDTALQPYDEVFGLQRFRETELIHGRCV